MMLNDTDFTSLGILSEFCPNHHKIPLCSNHVSYYFELLNGNGSNSACAFFDKIINNLYN